MTLTRKGILVRSLPLRRGGPIKRKGSIFQRRAVLKRDPLDTLWSTYIRLRDPFCRLQFLCRGNRSIEAAHVFRRGKFSTRWDPDDGLGACWACHRWADEHRTELEARALKLLGPERFNRLLVRSQLTAKQCGVDKALVREHLRQLLKVLESQQDGVDC